jgi:hypothetical protein
MTGEAAVVAETGRGQVAWRWWAAFFRSLSRTEGSQRVSLVGLEAEVRVAIRR